MRKWNDGQAYHFSDGNPFAQLHRDGVECFQRTDGDRSAIVSSTASIQRMTEEGVQMAEGSIKRLTDKGFGFITTGGAKDLFFHSSSLQGVSFDALHEGQKVTYTEGRGEKGPRAENVTLV